MKFIVSFEKTIQVAEDSWRVSLRTMLADENTTLRQIKEWYLRDNHISESSRCTSNNYGKMDDIKISEPEGV